MAQHKKTDQTLRKAFDAAYVGINKAQQLEFDTNKIKQEVGRAASTNQRIITASAGIFVLGLLIIAGIFAIQAYVDYLAWENRPTFAQRVLAPYNLEQKSPPNLSLAVTVDAQVDEQWTFTTANIENYKRAERPEANASGSTIVKLQSILPATIGDFTLAWDRKQPNLLSNCLITTGTEEDVRCQIPGQAEFLEYANFTSPEGNWVGLVMTKFATAEEASLVMDKLHSYARAVGRVGNFAMTNMVEVDYFYSATRGATSFTWLNNNWVMTIGVNNFEDMDQFMEAFPLYENNPNMDQILVTQISPSTPEPIVEPTTEVQAETTTESVASE